MGMCVFCGRSGPQTKEHVLPAWLKGMGLDGAPVSYQAGWLNRLPRALGAGRPFEVTVRDVCATCNSGWMSRLEAQARRILGPLILGQSAAVEEADLGIVAAWTQKTALVAMLVSPGRDRASGYGLPPAEYSALYDAREATSPLDASQFWIGRYLGPGGAHEQVTPLVVDAGSSRAGRPHGYLMTVIVGQLVLQGVRFTTPTVEVRLSAGPGLARLWPPSGRIVWPPGAGLGEADLIALCGGRQLIVEDAPLAIGPWGPAVDLAEGRLVGPMVECQALCGEHVFYYPALLGYSGMEGVVHAFVTDCECGVEYLVETRADGAHVIAAGGAEAVRARYDQLTGRELLVEDQVGAFVAKRLEPASSEGSGRGGGRTGGT